MTCEIDFSDPLKLRACVSNRNGWTYRQIIAAIPALISVGTTGVVRKPPFQEFLGRIKPRPTIATAKNDNNEAFLATLSSGYQIVPGSGSKTGLKSVHSVDSTNKMVSIWQHCHASTKRHLVEGRPT
jgi:hypothetical protein